MTDLYSFAAIFSFIVQKSIGCFIIMEYPGAMASVTGKAKNPWGSFLKIKTIHLDLQQQTKWSLLLYHINDTTVLLRKQETLKMFS